MNAENPAAITIDCPEISVAQPMNAVILFETPTPIEMPIAPPSNDSTTASVKNCVLTFDGLAPTAMRIPISRVRSLTDTSMMFMMPIPPTRSEIDATAPSNMLITLAVLAMLS